MATSTSVDVLVNGIFFQTFGPEMGVGGYYLAIVRQTVQGMDPGQRSNSGLLYNTTSVLLKFPIKISVSIKLISCNYDKPIKKFSRWSFSIIQCCVLIKGKEGVTFLALTQTNNRRVKLICIQAHNH